MENEELMNTTEFEETEDTEETEEESSSRSVLGTVGLMAIGSGLTLGIMAGIKKLKKVRDDYKAKKEAAKRPEVIYVDSDSAETVEEQPAPQPEEAEE